MASSYAVKMSRGCRSYRSVREAISNERPYRADFVIRLAKTIGELRL